MKSEIKLLFFSAAITGIFFWLELYFPFLKLWSAFFVFTALLALVIRLITTAPNKILLLIIPGCFMAAYVIKLIIEVISDPTSHNLWPFEIISLSMIVVLAALLGIGLGIVVKMITGKFSQPENR